MRDLNFAIDLQSFGSDAKSKIGTIVRKVALDLLREVVFLTPVDTGRARANWQTTVGGPAGGEVEWNGGSGAAAAGSALSQGAATIGAVAGDVSIYLTNNVPYIEALERGHSKQAPEGMVRKAIAQFSYLVEKAKGANP